MPVSINVTMIAWSRLPVGRLVWAILPLRLLQAEFSRQAAIIALTSTSLYSSMVGRLYFGHATAPRMGCLICNSASAQVKKLLSAIQMLASDLSDNLRVVWQWLRNLLMVTLVILPMSASPTKVAKWSKVRW